MKNVHIIGGGITGCSLAYFLKDKFNVILYEKSSRLGGLLQTFYSIENIPYQKGFHVLHTNKQWILNLIYKSGVKLQRIHYDVAIHPLIDFKYYRFPFNEQSLELMPWHWKEAILNDFDFISGASGNNLKEDIVNFYGKTIYEIFYKNYIKKITGYEADEIDDTTWFRRNLRSIESKKAFYEEDSYFPRNEGWNKLFYYLSKDVDLRLNQEVNFKNFSNNDIVILTSKIDSFFDMQELEYVGFDFEIDSVNYDEGKPDTIIYPNEVSFFAMTQYGKLFDPRLHVEGKNIIVKEYAKLNGGIPAYPVPKKKNIQKYQKLKDSIQSKYRNIYFCGHLAEYKHLSIAESIDSAQKISAKIKHDIR